MIYDYEIKKVKNEKVLYLYFDFSSEFANLKKSKSKKKINKVIEDYIKENKIRYTGQKIAIIVGGIMVATIAFNSYKKEIPANEFNYQNYSINVIDNNYKHENNVNDLEKETVNEEKTNKKEEQKPDEKVSNKTVSSVKKTTTAKTPTTKKEAPKVEKKVQDESKKTYVTINRRNGTVLNLELEEYIIGVVGAEMPAAFSLEALKAQAVIARTYAMNSIDNNKPLTDDSSTQNYKSNDELKKMWGSSFNTYFEKIKKAVESTKGMYLTYEGKIIDAVYHSTSNGKTEDAKYVWGNSMPYLVPVESPYDNTNKTIIYNKHITYEELSNKLGIDFNKDTNIEIVSKTTGDRVETLNIADLSYTGVDIRNILGLRSADFKINKDDNGITFTTTGYGHGVGLSQYGANGMAKNGYNFESILKHYYTGVTLMKK